MNVVFVVHYFPPLNSAGARRVLSFAKYLSAWGHQVTIVTTDKHRSDGDLTEPLPPWCRLITVAPRRPQSASGRGEAVISSSRSGLTWRLILLRRQLTRVFGQLIDHRLLFAARIAVPQLSRQAHEAFLAGDVIVSSCPPWPVHLAALSAARRCSKPWVADYRDQFSGNHLFPGNRVSSALERWLDRRMLRRAQSVTVVSEPMRHYYSRFHRNVRVIPNGYDEDHFSAPLESSCHGGTAHVGRTSDGIIIRHLGTISPDRIPVGLINSLLTLDETTRGRLRLEFYGESSILRTYLVKECPELLSHFSFHASVPHRNAVELMQTSDALLIMETSSADSLSAAGVLTTKLFEYLGARRPVIADIDATSQIGQVLTASGLAAVCSREPASIAKALMGLTEGTLTVTPNEDVISQYTRRGQARVFEGVLLDAATPAEATSGAHE